MQEENNLLEAQINNDNKELSLLESLIPVIILMGLLAYNIFAKDGAWLGDKTITKERGLVCLKM